MLPGALLGAAVTVFLLWQLGKFGWRRYAAAREEVYQPIILMAIAMEMMRRLGPPFSEGRRLGDWTIVEDAVVKWSKGLRGYARKAFCDIFEQNGFGEYEARRLHSLSRGARAEAARRLGQMLAFKAAPDLLQALEDPCAEVRRTASWALANMSQCDEALRLATTGKPRICKDEDLGRNGAVSGRFYWDDGEPVIGCVGGNVQSMGSLGSESPRAPYEDSGYRLNGVSAGAPAALRAKLRQFVGDYSVVVYRTRENVLVRMGYITEHIDFVFPKYLSPDDRISIMGKLVVPAPPKEDPARNRIPEAWVSIHSRDASFGMEYRSCEAVSSYRLHDVPPGDYHIRAAFGEYSYEAPLKVSQTQPMVLDLTLK